MESTAVSAALARSDALSAWIAANQPQQFQNQGANMMAVTLFSIAIEHREATLLLLQHGARSSAFALCRAVYETYLRGTWAQLCATEQDITDTLRNGAFPGIERMLRQLDKVEGMSGVFSATKRIAWEPMSDYAHSGLRQVSRWIGAEGVAPKHSDEEVSEILSFIDVYGLMASFSIATIAGVDMTAYSAKAREVLDHYRAATP